MDRHQRIGIALPAPRRLPGLAAKDLDRELADIELHRRAQDRTYVPRRESIKMPMPC
jgi:hypothetical protein